MPMRQVVGCSADAQGNKHTFWKAASGCQSVGAQLPSFDFCTPSDELVNRQYSQLDVVVLQQP